MPYSISTIEKKQLPRFTALSPLDFSPSVNSWAASISVPWKCFTAFPIFPQASQNVLPQLFPLFIFHSLHCECQTINCYLRKRFWGLKTHAWEFSTRSYKSKLGMHEAQLALGRTILQRGRSKYLFLCSPFSSSSVFVLIM